MRRKTAAEQAPRGWGGVLRIVSALCLCASAAGFSSQDKDWRALFNGKDLTGWERVGCPEADWGVEEDRLVTKGGKAGWLSTKEQYSDFELDLEYKVAPDGNSGVFLRSPREGNPWEIAMEIQILDDDAPKHKDIKAWQHTGSIYGAVAPSKPAQKKAGEWNRMQVLCRRNKVEIRLNGERIVDADLDQEEKLKSRPRRGYIGLQDHGTRCDFRNIRIRELRD